MNLLLTVPTDQINKEDIQECLRGKLSKKAEEVFRAIKGFFVDHHRFILVSYLDVIDNIRENIQQMDIKLREVMKNERNLLERLQEIPGVSEVFAATIVSLIGTTLDSFSTAASLCSWAGLCPGNNESGGKLFRQ